MTKQIIDFILILEKNLTLSNYGIGSHDALKATFNPNGDDVILQVNTKLYRLNCKRNPYCIWEELCTRMSHQLEYGVMTYLPGTVIPVRIFKCE